MVSRSLALMRFKALEKGKELILFLIRKLYAAFSALQSLKTLHHIGDRAQENFVSGQDAAFYAGLYREQGISGGHVILLNQVSSIYYEETKKQALSALSAYPKGAAGGRRHYAGKCRCFWMRGQAM